MILPEIDPVALQIGPLAIRWYGLTWLAAFYTIYFFDFPCCQGTIGEH